MSWQDSLAVCHGGEYRNRESEVRIRLLAIPNAPQLPMFALCIIACAGLLLFRYMPVETLSNKVGLVPSLVEKFGDPLQGKPDMVLVA